MANYKSFNSANTIPTSVTVTMRLTFVKVPMNDSAVSLINRLVTAGWSNIGILTSEATMESLFWLMKNLFLIWTT